MQRYLALILSLLLSTSLMAKEARSIYSTRSLSLDLASKLAWHAILDCRKRGYSVAAAVVSSMDEKKHRGAKPNLCINALGIVDAQLRLLEERLGTRFEINVAHATGNSMRLFEELAATQSMDCVVDLCLGEMTNMIWRGQTEIAKSRLAFVKKEGLDYACSLGGLWSIICNSEEFGSLGGSGHTYEQINEDLFAVKASWPCLKETLDYLFLAISGFPKAPTMVLPLKGVGFDRDGDEPMADSELLSKAINYISSKCQEPANTQIRLVVCDAHINDQEVTAALVDAITDSF